jgi:predicted TIM-barrel fold metal-dependent hydrolase
VADYCAFAAPDWCALFDRVHAIGWHAEVYVETGRLPEIARAFAATPIAVAFDHLGNPGANPATVNASFAAVAVLARSRPVWAKLSAPYRLAGVDPVALAARWLDAVGPSQLVWGSDWPWTNHERENDYVRLRESLDLWVGAERARAVIWDNAARLYDFA